VCDLGLGLVFGATQHVVMIIGQCEPPSRLKISDEHIQEEKQERDMAQMVQHVVSKTGVEEPRLNNSDF
jgi:hypothetical protein